YTLSLHDALPIYNTFVGCNVVSTDMLGNTACFALRHFGTADTVKKRCFTMVNMAHDGNHWCARCLCTTCFFSCFKQVIFSLRLSNQYPVMTPLFYDWRWNSLSNGLVPSNQLTHLHERFNNGTSLDRHSRSQVSHNNGFTNFNIVNLCLHRFFEAVLVALAGFQTAFRLFAEALLFL